MRLVAILSILLAGCQPYFSDNKEMSAFTIVASSFITNYQDREEPVKIAVLPLTPKVVLALSALRKEREHWTDERYRSETDELLMDVTGLAVDTASKRLAGKAGWDAPPDSIVLYVHIINTAWPCQNVTFLMGDVRHEQKLFVLDSDMPCPQVEVDSLLSKIRVNGSRATAIWGKRNQMLRDEETVLAIYKPKSTTTIEVSLP